MSSVVSHCNNDKIDIDVKFQNGELEKMIEGGNNMIEKFLKLSANMSVSNLYLYNHKNEITHYKSPLEIIEEFFEFRLEMYAVRRKKYLEILNNQLEILKNKIRFIGAIFDNKIKMSDDIITSLVENNYPKLSNENNEFGEKKSYTYLTNMKIFDMTFDNVEKLNKKYIDKKNEYDDYDSITEMELWKKELNEFLTFYEQWSKNEN